MLELHNLMILFGKNLVSNKSSRSSTLVNAQLELFWWKHGTTVMRILVGIGSDSKAEIGYAINIKEILIKPNSNQ